MASTNKTSNLGLNSWLETDRPKRIDFVSDNNIIDNVLGGHINDGDLHLTSDEKNRVSQPFKVMTLYGTGTATVQIKPGFTPNMAIVFKKEAPSSQYTGSYTKINAGIATSIGTSGGVSISGDSVEVQQSTSASNGIFYNLNESYAQYIVVAFR